MRPHYKLVTRNGVILHQRIVSFIRYGSGMRRVRTRGEEEDEEDYSEQIQDPMENVEESVSGE